MSTRLVVFRVPTTVNICFSKATQPTMADQSKIIKGLSIGKGLDAFRASFRLVCEMANVPRTPDALEQLGRQGTRRQRGWLCFLVF